MEATRTATINNWAHSLVESGQRPETTNPFKEPRAWNGAISTARWGPVSIWPPDSVGMLTTLLWVDLPRMRQEVASTQEDTSAKCNGPRTSPGKAMTCGARAASRPAQPKIRPAVLAVALANRSWTSAQLTTFQNAVT
ncbi:helicase domain protein [Mycolicibacterium canariasense]|uniref:Helicase domain protein n=1 Tax=Mycolicibacterium canariasense TaxID=228230 RepID=A0A100WK86_MYCCR|nr:helicase domain protein [Mycolicibacterium canariasense]